MKSFCFPLCCVVVLRLAALVQAQTFTTLYDFTGGSDGGEPVAGLIQDPTGNLYGTTQYGGVYKAGTVYEINAAGTEAVLYSFKCNGQDGCLPSAPLFRNNQGTLYGTTLFGGSGDWGIVFKIDSGGKETVLHTFAGGQGGCNPGQGLVMGDRGNLFGTTYQCGSHNRGTIFKVRGAGNFTVLYNFIQSPDGGRPNGGHLIKDKSGNLYGINSGGGRNSGVLYKLSTNGGLVLLHKFKGGIQDGCGPTGTVVWDGDGNLYGTTAGCGSSNYGTIWKVSKTGRETILHNFAGGAEDGCNPFGGVTRRAICSE